MLASVARGLCALNWQVNSGVQHKSAPRRPERPDEGAGERMKCGGLGAWPRFGGVCLPPFPSLTCCRSHPLGALDRI